MGNKICSERNGRGAEVNLLRQTSGSTPCRIQLSREYRSAPSPGTCTRTGVGHTGPQDSMPREDIRPESTGHTHRCASTAPVCEHPQINGHTLAALPDTSKTDTSQRRRSHQIQMETDRADTQTNEHQYANGFPEAHPRLPTQHTTHPPTHECTETRTRTPRRGHEHTTAPTADWHLIEQNFPKDSIFFFLSGAFTPGKSQRHPAVPPSSISSIPFYLSGPKPKGSRRGLVGPNYGNWTPRGRSPSCRHSQ